MIAKGRNPKEHMTSQKKLFERLRKYWLRLNPAKCTFGVTLGKLLGFIVSQRGIKVDPDKIKAIQILPHSKTQREIRGFFGRSNYISHFISQLTAKYDPTFKLLKKNSTGKRDENCQKAFDKVKEYLSNPPVLVPHMSNRPLILYLTVLENSIGYTGTT